MNSRAGSYSSISAVSLYSHFDHAFYTIFAHDYFTLYKSFGMVIPPYKLPHHSAVSIARRVLPLPADYVSRLSVQSASRSASRPLSARSDNCLRQEREDY